MPSVYWTGLSSFLRDLSVCVYCALSRMVSLYVLEGVGNRCELWGQASLLKDGLNFEQTEAHPS